jgi:hypothetical protein
MRSRVDSGRTTRRADLRGFFCADWRAVLATARACDSGFFIRVPEYTLPSFDLDPDYQEMCMKQIFGVVAGFILWSVLWLSLNQLLLILGVMSPNVTEPFTEAKPLLVLLAGSVLISLLSGYVTARITGCPWALPAVALGVLLLATGAFVQLKLWYLIPLWYHLSFLLLLIPVTLLGARIRAGSRSLA